MKSESDFNLAIASQPFKKFLKDPLSHSSGTSTSPCSNPDNVG